MDRKQWLLWRKSGIGSSDAPVIMGVSPWKTPMELWEEKISTDEAEEESGYILNKGNEIEPKIRSLFEIQEGKPFGIKLFTMDGFPFILASLDGISEDYKEIIEIKLMGKDDWENAKKGIVAEKYFPQMQHQLMVTGAKVCKNLCYLYEKGVKEMKVENLTVVDVFPDVEYQAKLLQAEIQFWDLVQKKKPPMETDRDYKRMKTKGFTAKARKYSALKEKIDALSEQADAIRKEIEEEAAKMKHPRIALGDLRIAQISKVGNVNYKSIPELKGVDLDKYRGKGSTYWKITETSEH